MTLSPYTPEEIKKIEARIAFLRTMRKDELIHMAGRTHRVIDLRGMDKGSAISMILTAEFGRGYWDRLEDGRKAAKKGTRK